MTTHNEPECVEANEARPFYIDVIEYILHQACFLWWRLTNQLPKNMPNTDG